MKHFFVTVITMSAACVMPTVAVAYEETPFANAKLGETKTYPGWIVQSGGSANPFLVFVRIGCGGGHIAFVATAASDVVPKDQLGKPVMITAKVVEKFKSQTISLKILHVERIAKNKEVKAAGLKLPANSPSPKGIATATYWIEALCLLGVVIAVSLLLVIRRRTRAR